MPQRMLRVIETVIDHLQPSALWIDAVCIPQTEPERSSALMRMGEIYANASIVCVVLSEECHEVLSTIQTSERITQHQLDILDRDSWVSRVWTYPELVNSSRIRFIAEGAPDVSVEAIDVLNQVGTAIHRYKEEKNLGAFTFRKMYPNVDSLEDAIVDWRVAEYGERFAYQVMSAMANRRCRIPEERYIAMLSALTVSPTPNDTEFAYSFIAHCQSKQDFSYLFSAAPRRSEGGSSWEPTGDHLWKPVFPWHCWGKKQSGYLKEERLYLENLFLPKPGPLCEEAVVFLKAHVLKQNVISEELDLPWLVFSQLKEAGLEGVSECMETPQGLMYSSFALPEKRNGIQIAVSTEIRSALGGPCLILTESNLDTFECLGAGFFVGKVPKIGQSVLVS